MKGTKNGECMSKYKRLFWGLAWLSLCAPLWRPGFAGLDPGHGPIHHSSSHAVVASHIQNRGRLSQTLAQGQSSSSKKVRLATDVSSGPIFLTHTQKDYLFFLVSLKFT